jgi:acyl carrier protein
MTREEVFAKLQTIFRDIFDDAGLAIEETTNSSTIEDWDSLNHINLVVAIEKEFKIKFNLSELATLKDVGSMVDLMMAKML